MKPIPLTTYIKDTTDLINIIAELDAENERLVKVNENYARGLALLAKEKEDAKVLRN